MFADGAPPLTVAFYLPQYHPIPENDQWWGTGFTEWRNVASGQPKFRGHYQPRLPGELGFYDLRLGEVRVAQAELAKGYGIDAFCYYHYWFSGRRLLSRPLDDLLDSGAPDFPFLLCWANESWTRRWDGLEQEVLLRQTYSDRDHREHIEWLARPLSDPRYLRISSRPVLLVYRAGDIPDIRRMTDIWRDEAAKLGLGDLFLGRVESLPGERGDPVALGFDASVEFQPDWALLPRQRLRTRLGHQRRRAGNRVIHYDDLVDAALSKTVPPYRFFRCVTPGWDNSARRRRGGATIISDATPERYGEWVEAMYRESLAKREALFFVNAWNEWGEGAHLEPCARWGRRFLEAHKKAADSAGVGDR